MKLLTLNCHSWQEDDQLNKISELAHTIRENDYDVIALQEVSQHMLGKQFKGQLKKDNYGIVLLKELEKLGVSNYEIVWDFSHIGFQVYEEGLCLLFKHPIIKNESFFVSETEDRLNWKARKIVKATILYHEEEIDVYSCHLGWWNDEEEPCKAQLDKLNAQLSKKNRSFMMGDFNNNGNIKGEGYSYIKELGWLDTYELPQVNDKGEAVNGSNAEVLRSSVIFNGKNERVISDHYGVEVELKW